MEGRGLDHGNDLGRRGAGRHPLPKVLERRGREDGLEPGSVRGKVVGQTVGPALANAVVRVAVGDDNNLGGAQAPYERCNQLVAGRTARAADGIKA